MRCSIAIRRCCGGGSRARPATVILPPMQHHRLPSQEPPMRNVHPARYVSFILEWILDFLTPDCVLPLARATTPVFLPQLVTIARDLRPTTIRITITTPMTEQTGWMIAPITETATVVGDSDLVNRIRGFGSLFPFTHLCFVHDDLLVSSASSTIAYLLCRIFRALCSRIIGRTIHFIWVL